MPLPLNYSSDLTDCFSKKSISKFTVHVYKRVGIKLHNPIYERQSTKIRAIMVYLFIKITLHLG